MSQHCRAFLDRRHLLQFGGAAMVASAFINRDAYAQSPEPFDLALAGIDIQYSAVYVAKAKGYFSEQGITLNMINSQSGPRTRQIVAAGQALVGMSAALDSTALTAAGKQSTLILGIDKRMAWANILVRKQDVDSGKLRTVKDLDGLVIAVTQPLSAATATAQYITQKAGAKKIEFKSVGDMVNMYSALKSGQVDACIATLLMVDQATQDGWGVPLFSSADDAAWNSIVGGDAPGIACFTLQDSIQNPAKARLLQGFVSSMVKAQDFIMSNSATAIGDVIFDEYFQGGFQRPVFERTLAFLKDKVYSSDNMITSEGYGRMMSIVRLGGLIPEVDLDKPTILYDKAVDLSFVKNARKI